MGTSTKISWTDATWNPIKARRLDTGKVGWHCEKISSACKFCYAATMNRRNLPNAGTGLDYVRSSRDQVEVFADPETLTDPLRWRKPRKIFVVSMSDLFAEFVTDEMIDRVFAVMACCQRHTFQILTKRPERMAAYLDGSMRESGRWDHSLQNGGFPWPDAPGDVLDSGYAAITENHALPNVWLGVTAEDQETANARVPHLLKCPAAVRFVSYEPAMGPLNVSRFALCKDCQADRGETYDRIPEPCDGTCPRLHWLIIGTESGPKRRPMKLEWAENAIRDCRAAGVAPFVKQLPVKGKVSHDPETWPAWAQVQDFPASDRGTERVDQ